VRKTEEERISGGAWPAYSTLSVFFRGALGVCADFGNGAPGAPREAPVEFDQLRGARLIA